MIRGEERHAAAAHQDDATPEKEADLARVPLPRGGQFILFRLKDRLGLLQIAGIDLNVGAALPAQQAL